MYTYLIDYFRFYLAKQTIHYQLSSRARKVDNKNWVSLLFVNAYNIWMVFFYICFLLRICRMDSFVQCATQMLKELRILLQNTPIVLTTLRLVQLMALNIFAIDSTQQKGKCIWSTYTSVIENRLFTYQLPFYFSFLLTNNNFTKHNNLSSWKCWLVVVVGSFAVESCTSVSLGPNVPRDF